MKKNGFTLAEALIALGIVGVVAALILPMANKFKPDQNKITYLKTYDSLVETVKAAASNKKIYPVMNSNEIREEYKNVVYSDYPLYNTIGVNNVFSGVNLAQGEKKFCEVLAYSFGADKNSINCSVNNLTGTNYSFKTKAGADFIVKTTVKAPSANKGDFKSEVLLDIDGLKNGKNVLYSEDNTSPDQFKFVIYADGRVAPNDEKGRSYLTTRSNWKKTDDNMDNLTYEGANSSYENFDILVYVEPEIEAPPEEPEEEVVEEEPVEYVKLNLKQSYIANNSSYGDINAYMAARDVYAEPIVNEPKNQQDANKYCAEKGLRLPSYFDLSALGNYVQDFEGYKSGNYWATPGTDGKPRVCNLPKGNCGTNSSSNKFPFVCVRHEAK